MNTYLLVHKHKRGITTKLFQSSKNYEGFYDNDDADDFVSQPNPNLPIAHVLEALGCNFEPHRDETIDITSIDLGDIPTVEGV